MKTLKEFEIIFEDYKTNCNDMIKDLDNIRILFLDDCYDDDEYVKESLKVVKELKNYRDKFFKEYQEEMNEHIKDLDIT